MNTSDLETMVGETVYGSDGGKIGKVADIYLDEQTNEPEWLAINTGLFGTRVSFVPVTDLTVQDENYVVPFEEQLVKDAPNCDADGHLSQDEEAALYAHYGMNYSESASDTGLPTGQVAPQAASTDEDSMVLAEEQLKVSTSTHEAGKVRLRKYVVTENQTVTVPVRHEEVRIEREAVTDGTPVEGSAIGEEVREVTLHAEQVNVDKNVVAKERVRIGTETVTEDQQVSEEVRSEEVEVSEDERRG